MTMVIINKNGKEMFSPIPEGNNATRDPCQATVCTEGHLCLNTTDHLVVL